MSYDPEYADGRGMATWTERIEEARAFPSIKAAMEYVRQVPRARPTRPDGRPNRPLTAFSVSLVLVR